MRSPNVFGWWIASSIIGRAIWAVVERFGSIFARDSERRYRAARGSAVLVGL
jgi:hypothetical protein